MNRREFLLGSAVASTVGSTLISGKASVETSFDLLIRNARIVDGTGAPPWPGDLAIRGDRIGAMGRIDPAQAAEVIDASGLHLTPGFIDIHTHSDLSIFEYPGADSRIFQGITTEVTGNCGSSPAPAAPGDAEVQDRWTDVASYLDRLDQARPALNQALLLGQGSLREAVAGMENRPLTAEERATLERMVDEGMAQGAFGLSTGLEYTPGRFTPSDEIIALARVVARYGGFYASHIRNEEAQLLEAVDEAIQIGRQSGARVEISHLKATGKGNWGKQVAALDLIESARRAGVDVLADAYPYTAYSTALTILLPTWALVGGWDAVARRLADAQTLATIEAEIAEQVKDDPGGWDLIRISSVKSEANRPFVGKNLAEIASTWGVRGEQAATRLLREEEGSVGFVGFGMSEANVERVLSHPLVMIGSDGSSQAPEGEALRSRPHPRSYGAFARVLRHYMRERRLFDLPTAVRKMTSLPADQAGLRDRGRLARGKAADLLLFDPERIVDEATFDDPLRRASGMRFVFVNGVAVLRNGETTGSRPGKALRRS